MSEQSMQLKSFTTQAKADRVPSGLQPDMLKQYTLADVVVTLPLSLLLIVIPEQIAGWAGGFGSGFYQVVGIIMALWAVDMGIATRRAGWLRRMGPVMVAVDTLWALTSLALLAVIYPQLSLFGLTLFALNVVVPAVLGLLKYRAMSPGLSV